MNRYHKGRRLEYQAMRELVLHGYLPVRSAGSHTPFDIIGISGTDVLLLQVKAGKIGKDEARRLREIPLPECAKVQVWTWRGRAGWCKEVFR